MNPDARIVQHFKTTPTFLGGLEGAVMAVKRAKSATSRHLLQHSCWQDLVRPDSSYEITWDHTIGDSIEQRKNVVATATSGAEQIFRAAYRVADTEVRNLAIMSNGTTRPVRMVGEVPELGGEKILYLKEPDVARLFGLELYRILSGVDYKFHLLDGAILEEHTAGNHRSAIQNLDELSELPGAHGRMDALSHIMGLDDMAKDANYVILADGRIKIIDFDVLDRTYDAVSKAQTKQLTCEMYAMSEHTYDSLYAQERVAIAQRAKKYWGRIESLLAVFEGEDRNASDLSELRERVQQNMAVLVGVEQ